MNLEPCPRFFFRRGGLVAALALHFVLLSTSFLEAQQTGSVTGTVTDAASLRPVSDARVFIAGIAVEVFTDVEGNYRLGEVPVGEVEIRLERLGYGPVNRTLQVAAGQTSTVDFGLLVSAVALDQLLVTATGLQRRRELGNAAAVIRVRRRAGTCCAGEPHRPAPGSSHGSAGFAELRHRWDRLDHQDPRKRHDQPE